MRIYHREGAEREGGGEGNEGTTETGAGERTYTTTSAITCTPNTHTHIQTCESACNFVEGTSAFAAAAAATKLQLAVGVEVASGLGHAAVVASAVAVT